MFLVIRVFLLSLGVLLFLYLFWRRLKEDYLEGQIFTEAFFILFGTFLGFLLSVYFYPKWWFWLSFGGSILGLLIGVYRYRLRFYEILDSWVLAIMPLLGMTFLEDSLRNRKISSFIGFFIISVLFTIFLLLDKRYKRFSWYKSGRIGFSGLSLLGLFFVIRSAVAVTFLDVLSFGGKVEAIISASLAFTSFLAVYNLSRSRI